MQSHRFVQLGLAAFGLAIASFLVMGLGRLVVPVGVARTAAAPLFLGGFVAAVAAFALALLATGGVVDLDHGAE